MVRQTFRVAVIGLSIAALHPALGGCLIETFAGGGRSFSGDGGLAVGAEFDGLTDAVVAPDGTIYAADSGNSRVRRITPDGIISTLAGPGAGLQKPARLATAPDGAVLAHDEQARRLWRIAPDGAVTNLLDTARARMGVELGLAAGADGVVYLADPEKHRVWRLDGEGAVTVFAGTGEPGDRDNNGDGGPAAMARFDQPRDVALWPDGAVYIAESGAGRVRRVQANGVVNTAIDLRNRTIDLGSGFATGLLGWMGASSSGHRRPLRLAPGDGFLDVLFDDDPDGAIHLGVPGFVGVDLSLQPVAPAQSVFVLAPSAPGVIRYRVGAEPVWSAPWVEARSVATLPDGRALIADRTDRLLAYTPRSGAFQMEQPPAPEIVAGMGPSGPAGDGGPARNARLWGPGQVVARRSGEVFIADSERVRWIDRSGVIRSLPGDLPNARLAVDRWDNVYIATDERILRMRASGLIEQIAVFERCESLEADCGDGGPLRAAKFFGFASIAAGADGTLYVLDGSEIYSSLQVVDVTGGLRTIPVRTTERRLRNISPSGQIGTALSLNEIGFGRLTLGSDASGGALLARSSRGELWRVEGGSRETVPGYTGYIDTPTAAGPVALLGTENGDVYFARDHYVGVLRADGHVNRIAGGSTDATPLERPAALALTATGDLLIADSGANAVRIVRDVTACDATVRPQIRLDGVRTAGPALNGFSYANALLGSPVLVATRPPVAPGSLISIYGTRLGPAATARTDLAAAGRLPLELGGVTVEVNGKPAPLLYAAHGQINAVMPPEIPPAGRASVRVWVDGVASDEAFVEMSPASPNVLATLNPDGSANSLLRRVAPGDEVTLLVTGLRLEGADPAAVAVQQRDVSAQGLRIRLNTAGTGGNRPPVEVLSVRTVPGAPESLTAVRFRAPAPGQSSDLALWLEQEGALALFSVSVRRDPAE